MLVSYYLIVGLEALHPSQYSLLQYVLLKWKGWNSSAVTCWLKNINTKCYDILAIISKFLGTYSLWEFIPVPQENIYLSLDFENTATFSTPPQGHASYYANTLVLILKYAHLLTYLLSHFLNIYARMYSSPWHYIGNFRHTKLHLLSPWPLQRMQKNHLGTSN
jgi:hypothetical protein